MKTSHSISQLGRMLRDRSLGCLELTQDVLGEIDKRNPHLNAFSNITRERALQEAAQAQSELDRGLDRGPLHGIPYAIKELFDLENAGASAGTPLLDHYIGKADAGVIRRLAEAGAVLVGQTHTSPLAATILGVNPARGTPHNPWKREAYIPGGSSSGSAVAVSAGLVPFALGTDTGGSIRVPAALCGAAGLCLTTGSVDSSGMRPLAPSLDSIGPLARSAQDIEFVRAAIQNGETKNPPDLKDLRIGVCESVFFDDAQEEIPNAVFLAARILEKLGATIFNVQFEELERLHQLACETSLIAAEAYPLHREIVDHPDADWVLHWLRVARDYSPQHIQKALNEKNAIQAQLAERMRDLDAVLAPTTPRVAVPVSTCDRPDTHAELSAAMSRNTRLGNLAGWCGLSIPSGFTTDGLPMGLMIYAGPRQELIVIQVARAFESSYHAKREALQFSPIP
ncbi:MAG: amidase [Candidatus Nitrohelix vancouverensis]|uniref:Amidase n=1 Tax=Candidatus Nitrohelix vancouverensis TaxID=2705534 RepID=A0A7T0C0W1_9BACT|nr:MAG: amidase [Candidatus Nitrohelix vancouverensis]